MRAPLWLLTRGAVSVGPSDRLASPLQSQVWGLGLVAGLEYPHRWGGMVDLPEALDRRAQVCLAGALGGAVSGALGAVGREDQLAVRAAGMFARRLVRAGRGGRAEAPRWSPPAGTVLITGGTGGLGAHVARWLAGSGAEHLLLVSRRGAAAPGAAELQAELRALGAQVTVAACDVSDREQLALLLESVPDAQPLSAVFHAAGAPGYGALETLTVADLAGVLAAKAQAALHLDQLTEHVTLSAFVMFSSIAATFGSWYQGHYAAANAFLDGLAANRRARGFTAMSVAWGAWAGEGMAAAIDAAEIARHGLGKMAPELALEALQLALDRDETVLVIADVKWEAYLPLLAAASVPALIGDLPEVRGALQATVSATADAGRELAQRLAELPVEERALAAIELVRTETARVLGHATSEAVDPERAFKELGLGSLASVELRNRLSSATALRLPATLVFDYPTPLALGEYLLTMVVGDEASAADAVERELGRLERSLASLADDGARAAACERLQMLLTRLGDARSQDGVAVAGRIQSASDEEIFTFIDRELGGGSA